MGNVCNDSKAKQSSSRPVELINEQEEDLEVK